MVPTACEIAEKDRFDAIYEISRSAVIQQVTDDVCGCGYVGTSWTTLSEADYVLQRLGLSQSCKLLELGAGAGWPGLYLALKSGCHVTLLDMPETGLRLALERAAKDGISDQVNCIAGDAAELPFQSAAFDAINHSDMLCCLVEKQRVLEECRRVLSARGLMAFTVIAVAPGLSSEQRAFAIENGPPFVDAERSYPEMLDRAGWNVIEHKDLTKSYEAACKRMLKADLRYKAELTSLLGPEEVSLRREKWTRKIVAIERRLTIREFYLAAPA